MSNNNEKEKDIDTKDSRFGAYEREMERREQKQAKEKRKKKVNYLVYKRLKAFISICGGVECT